jgi:hypothetical protein
MSQIKSISLPIELTNLILEFSGYHRKRNGKYMKQLTEADIKVIKEKIQMMPKIIRGYVKLDLPLRNTRTPEKTTIILIGPSCEKICGRL